MKSIPRLPLTDQVSDAILEMIRAQGLVDGDAIPSVRELSQALGVSVPVVREAIAGLSSLGLLKRQQGRETVVSTPDADHLSRLFSYRVASAAVTDASVQSFREIVEVGSARAAASNADPEAISAIRAAFDRMTGVDSEEDLHDADVAFHAAVARASKNDLLILTLDALAPLLRRLRTRVWSGWVAGGGDLQSIIQAHAVVLDAIERHDPEAAGAAMIAHMKQARLGLEQEPR